MNIERMVIAKFGVFDHLELSLGKDPGLVLIYGRNEAGKSTCLSAITDFLFSIPPNTSFGRVYGYDAMRLDFDLRLSAGKLLNLSRRKGRGRSKTLLDSNAALVDENVLSAPLGSIDRLRFLALFGLDHRTLRSGGEQLLAAEGDIGRLIVEAGGGLRALVNNVERLRAQADTLYTPRKGADKAFYKALELFNTADKEFKAALLTFEKYDQTKSALTEVNSTLDQHRTEYRESQRQRLDLQRIERVFHPLYELDKTKKELEGFADIEKLPPQFSDLARLALEHVSIAREVLDKAKGDWEDLNAEISALVVPAALLQQESSIRRAEQKATHLRKQREERPRRQHELDEQRAKLSTLRQSIGVSESTDLTHLLPSNQILTQVQQLATEYIADRSRAAALDQQIEAEIETLDTVQARQLERAQRNQDRPSGFSITDFANIVQLSKRVGIARTRKAELAGTIERRLSAIGFDSLEELNEIEWPDVDVVQSQIDLIGKFEHELAKQVESVSDHAAGKQEAQQNLARLKASGDIPSDLSISSARTSREEYWETIRKDYLTADAQTFALLPQELRTGKASAFEERVAAADNLADRRSVEADRIASLDLFERNLAAADAALAAAAVAKGELNLRCGTVRESFASAWGRCLAIEPELGKLKLLLEGRKQVLDAEQQLIAASNSIEEVEAELNAVLECLISAERAFQVLQGPSISLSDRVRIVVQKIKQHDDGYSDYRNDEKLIEVSTQNLSIKRKEAQALASKMDLRKIEWKSAVTALSMSESTSPEVANSIATLWAAAEGVIDSIKLTERRLQRMDEDESELWQILERLEPELTAALPEDCIASVEMLKAKLEDALRTQARREGLMPQLGRFDSQRKRAQEALDSAERELQRVCEESSTAESDLLSLADRHDRSTALSQELQQLLSTIQTAGDGLPIQQLEDARSGYTIDTIRIQLTDCETENNRLSELIESEIRTADQRSRELRELETDDRLIRFSADRERAVAEIHETVERYLELNLAEQLILAALDRVRNEQQDPLIIRAGELFSLATRGTFNGIGTDIDEKGNPAVVGMRSSGALVSVKDMSDGTRDQLFLAFRIASIEHYCRASEPLPFIGDDLLVHFDDDRSIATLKLLAELAKTTQVLLFTHHRSVRDGASAVLGDSVTIIDLPDSTYERSAGIAAGA